MTTEGERRFEELYDANWQAVLGYALRRTDSADEAADVLADTFVIVWRRLESVPRREETRPWLYGVARRVLANQRRGTVRRGRLGERLHQQLLLAPCEEWPDVSATRHVIQAAIDRLDDDDRELLRLTSWEGLSPAEIAISAGIPAATARTRLHRARKRLRDELLALGWTDERSSPAGHEETGERLLVVAPEQEP